MLVLAALCGISGGCRKAAANTRGAPLSVGLAGQRIPDLDFVDQTGAHVRLLSDVFKTRSVLLAFMYTTCTKSCPLTAGVFAKTQALIAERKISTIQLISVSVAAEDSRDAVGAWARRFGATAPTWRVLFASQDIVQSLAQTLTSAPAAKGAHTPIILVGNRHTGLWHREYGIQNPELLLAAAESTQIDDPNAP